MKKIMFLAIIFLCISYLFAENKLGIGLGWPYVSLKYNFSQNISSELKFAVGEGINIFAGRFYWNFYRKNALIGVTGVEAGYIDFDTLNIKGYGGECSLFIGGEYFITRRLSFVLDFSPTFIILKSDDFEIEDIEWVVNFAFYYYFLRK